MKKIPLTQGQFALVDDEDYEYLMRFKWHATRVSERHSWYAKRWTRQSEQTPSRLISMHREILGITDSKILVDHADCNGLNNQRENIRPASYSQNGANRSKTFGKSVYKGVSWHKHSGKWRAYVNKDYKLHCVGYFKDEIEAALAYNEAAIKIHGEFANINIIR